MESHLLQMRGLKRCIFSTSLPTDLVASFTDAWIETNLGKRPNQNFTVASFTDAWIETVDESAQTMTVTSHLLQMRGLKRCREQYLKTRVEVASFTDAWIET